MAGEQLPSPHTTYGGLTALLIAALVLGVGTALLELTLYWKVPAVRKMISKFEWSGLVLSFCLAFFLGHIFGAVGTTVMIGGVLSMILTQPFYYYVNRGREQLCQLRNETKEWIRGCLPKPMLWTVDQLACSKQQA